MKKENDRLISIYMPKKRQVFDNNIYKIILKNENKILTHEELKIIDVFRNDLFNAYAIKFINHNCDIITSKK